VASLSSRLEKAESAEKERLMAEWRAAVAAQKEIILAAPADELAAWWRLVDVLGQQLEDGAPELEGEELLAKLEPGDKELLEKLDARMPSEVIARLEAAAAAARAVGLE
jgi:hypothetical protein